MRNEATIFKLRLEPELHAKLKIVAFNSHRTLSEEILLRIEQSLLDHPQITPPKGRSTPEAANLAAQVMIEKPTRSSKKTGAADLNSLSAEEIDEMSALLDKLRGLVGNAQQNK